MKMDSQISLNIIYHPSCKSCRNSFKLEANYIKTSESKEWECKPFTLEFLEFIATENMVMKLHIYTSFMASPAIINIIGNS